jgi:hypothetical protein
MTNGRLRRAAVSAILAAACCAFLGPAVGFAAETPDAPGPSRMVGAWLGPVWSVKGWRYITRYQISVTGNRFHAVGELYIQSPQGLTKQRPPAVSEFTGSIDGSALTGEVSLYRRNSAEAGKAATRPLVGTVDFDRGEIAIRYNGPSADNTSDEAADASGDTDRTLTLQLLGRKP